MNSLLFVIANPCMPTNHTASLCQRPSSKSHTQNTLWCTTDCMLTTAPQRRQKMKFYFILSTVKGYKSLCNASCTCHHKFFVFHSWRQTSSNSYVLWQPATFQKTHTIPQRHNMLDRGQKVHSINQKLPWLHTKLLSSLKFIASAVFFFLSSPLIVEVCGL